MKKISFSILVIIMLSNFLMAEDCSDDISKQLKIIHTAYAESKSGKEQAKYCIATQKELIEKFYKGGYTPKRYGFTEFWPRQNCYVLEEFFDSNSLLGVVEHNRFIYFKKVNNTFKIDWEASTGYNSLTLTKFEALRDKKEYEFRCYVQLGSSYNDDYYSFYIHNPNWKYVCKAQTKKDSSLGKMMIDMFEGDEFLPLILKLKYYEISETRHELNMTESKFESGFMITDFVKFGWNKQ